MHFTPPNKILLVQLRRFGDVVITTALATDLRREFPGATIHFMTGRMAAPLLLHNPDIDEVVIFEPGRMRHMIATVRRNHYDWLIDVQAHPRTAILARLSGIPVRAGWDARFWGFAYTHRTPRDTTPTYAVQNRRRLLALLGVRTGNTLPRLHLLDAERQKAASIIGELNLPPDRPLVGLAIGTHDPFRDWRIDGFARVAEILESDAVNVVVFRFPGDDDLIAEFRRHTGAATIVEWPGDRIFLALLASCATLVSANTGPSHMALALGVPRVTIYGSTNSVLWSPGLTTTIALSNPRQECLGCGPGNCPVNRECVRGISADEVAQAVQQLLREAACASP